MKIMFIIPRMVGGGAERVISVETYYTDYPYEKSVSQ